MTTTYEKIKQEAEQLIEEYAMTTPVHIFQLADLMGIKWENCTPEYLKKCISKKEKTASKHIDNWEDVLGYYDTTDKKILLNSVNQPITRKRFTMAHEIGHVILHHNFSNLLRKIFMRQDIVKPADEIEAEANYFAGYLLMPDRDIEEKLSYTIIIGEGEDIVKSFAKMFAVSTDAMRIRLRTYKREHPEIWKQHNMEEKLF